MTISITAAAAMVAAVAVGFASGWLYAKARTLSDYNAMYAHLTCEIVSRMTKAMRTLCMDQETIDRVVERMGCKLVWAIPDVPPPPAPSDKGDGDDEEKETE